MEASDQINKKIIILDDDVAIGEMLSDYLITTTGSSVTYCSDESEFWNRLENQAFDVLFLDYRLKSANGLEILSQLAVKEINLPTIMMTGEGNEHIAVRAIQEGAIDYLVKGSFLPQDLPLLIQKAAQIRALKNRAGDYLGKIRYQALLLNNIQDAVVVWGLNHEILYWNHAAEDLLGVSANRMLGKNVDQAYLCLFNPPLIAPNQENLSSIEMEHNYYHPDQKVIWVSSRLSTLFDFESADQPIGFMDVLRDITLRKNETNQITHALSFIQRVVETSPNIIYIYNLQINKFVFINSEVETILGYSPKEILGLSRDEIIALFPPESRETIIKQSEKRIALHEDDVVEFEFRFITKNNGLRWFKTRETVFSLTNDGKAHEIIGVIQNITKLKQAHQKLEKRLQREELQSSITRQFLNLAPDSTSGGIQVAFNKICQFFEIEAGALYIATGTVLYNEFKYLPGHISSPFANFIQIDKITTIKEWLYTNSFVVGDPEKTQIPNLADELLEIIPINQPTSAAVFALSYNNHLLGMMVFLPSRAEPIWVKQDLMTLSTFAGIFSNALAHQKADRELRISEARYRGIVEEHQSEMICRFDKNANLTFVNDAYCKFYGKEKSTLLGTNFFSAVYAEDGERNRSLLKAMSNEDENETFEQRILLPSRGIRWQEWVCHPIADTKGKIVEYQSVGRDISHRKEMEEQLDSAHTRLTQAARLASIGELASGVAHQISNPLTTIIADAQLLTHELGSDHPGHESADAILIAGWQAQKVIQELMKFSQPTFIQNEQVSINDTIAQALLLSSAHMQAAGIQIRTDFQNSLPYVRGNERELTDVWVNLLLLARSASSGSDENFVQIVTKTLGQDTIEITFMDNGRLIPFEQRSTIFEPKLIPVPSMRGTGIELSLCREIIRKHQGEILYECDGKNTIFNVSLPKGFMITNGSKTHIGG